MLQDVIDRSTVTKKIAIVSSSDELNEFLRHLLTHWKFELHRPDHPEVLLLAEEGQATPLPGQRAIWMTRSRYQGADRLNVPITFEALWQKLEHRFHRPPRTHIRMNVEMSALVTVNDSTVSARLRSLSDMGCRFSYHRELVRDQSVVISLTLDGEEMRIDSRVIYAVPGREEAGAFTVGLLFRGIDKKQRDRLRSFLIWRYLEKVRAKMDGYRFRTALGYFDLPDFVLERLGAPEVAAGE
ncbi:MAG: hypothetical protein C0615_12220 [Desulfuromonas sp.]|nr:MAG: hypothetical protein C0615_12220 [Desulfuromonas sp.]